MADPAVCQHCGQVLPDHEGVQWTIPFNDKYHLRCRLCGWPCARSVATEDGRCRMCQQKQQNAQTQQKRQQHGPPCTAEHGIGGLSGRDAR